MDPAAILDELLRSQDLPREALRAAAARRADMVPLFVDRIETYLQTGTTGQTGDAPLFFIFHLLGDWRETSAYRPLARLLRCPSSQVDAAIAESITETTHRVMAAVFDGDPSPIYNIILDANADEFVRSRMCETLAMLVVQGRLDRAEVASFLRDCWIGLQPRDGCFVWHGWQSTIAMLGLVELKEIVKQAFERGIIDRRWLRYRDFEADLERAVRQPDRALAQARRRLHAVRRHHRGTLQVARLLGGVPTQPRPAARCAATAAVVVHFQHPPRPAQPVAARHRLSRDRAHPQSPARRRPQRSLPLRQRREIQAMLPAVARLTGRERL